MDIRKYSDSLPCDSALDCDEKCDIKVDDEIVYFNEMDNSEGESSEEESGEGELIDLPSIISSGTPWAWAKWEEPTKSDHARDDPNNEREIRRFDEECSFTLNTGVRCGEKCGLPVYKNGGCYVHFEPDDPKFGGIYEESKKEWFTDKVEDIPIRSSLSSTVCITEIKTCEIKQKNGKTCGRKIRQNTNTCHLHRRSKV